MLDLLGKRGGAWSPLGKNMIYWTSLEKRWYARPPWEKEGVLDLLGEKDYILDLLGKKKYNDILGTISIESSLGEHTKHRYQQQIVFGCHKCLKICWIWSFATHSYSGGLGAPSLDFLHVCRQPLHLGFSLCDALQNFHAMHTRIKTHCPGPTPSSLAFLEGLSKPLLQTWPCP